MDALKLVVNTRSPLEIAVVACATLFGSYWAAIAFYNIYLSPLRKIPGPWYAAISNFWLTTHVLLLRRCRAVDELSQKYGPIVRVGPNKIIFNDAPTTKLVYGVSAKLDKSEFYSSLKTYVRLTCRHAFFCFHLTYCAGTEMIKRRFIFYPCEVLFSGRFRMSVLNHADHGVRKRGYAPHYIQANLNLFQSDFHNIVINMIHVSYP